MGVRRRIVPDTSVMIPAFFLETIRHQGNDLNLSSRATRIRNAMWDRQVGAFAPHMLIVEFVKAARRKADELKQPEVARQSCEEFLRFLLDPDGNRLRKPYLTLVDSADLARMAMDFDDAPGLDWADVWFLACAKATDAELWLSHRQADGIVEVATRAGVEVRLLTEDPF